MPTSPDPDVRAALDRVVAALEAAGVPDARVDAELMIGHELGLRRGAVQAAAVTGRRLDAAQVEAIEGMTARRARREPVQHITGRAGFRTLELAVGPGVFVPRPETELTAQLAIDAVDADAAAEPIAIDLGTGSGAIALSIAAEVPRARVIAVERHPAAFAGAVRNRDDLGLDAVRLVEADLADAPALLPDIVGRAAVVVSNPPYVPDDAVPRDPEVRLFDPATALYGGPDGLDVVRTVSRVAYALARPGGLVVIEHGELQGASVRDILVGDGWRAASTHRDLTQRDRTTTAHR